MGGEIYIRHKSFESRNPTHASHDNTPRNHDRGYPDRWSKDLEGDIPSKHQHFEYGRDKHTHEGISRIA